MLLYRGCVQTSKTQTADEATFGINNDGHLLIEGKRNSSDQRGESVLSIYLIGGSSDWCTNLPETRKMLGIKRKEVASEHGKNIRSECVFVFIGDVPVRILKYAESGEDPYFEALTSKLFCAELPLHYLVPRHTIADPIEIKKYCGTFHCSKNDFPLILQSDPQAIWIGLKKGMCVRIDRPSETAGASVMYRICV